MIMSINEVTPDLVEIELLLKDNPGVTEVLVEAFRIGHRAGMTCGHDLLAADVIEAIAARAKI